MDSRCVLGFFLLNTLRHGFGEDPAAHLTLKHNWSQIFWSERVTFRCEIEGSEDTGWMYTWRTPTRQDKSTTQNEYSITATQSDNGEYMCLGRKKHSQGYTDSQWSSPISLTVTSYRPRTELKADMKSFHAGGTVTLTCNIDPPSSGWTFHWLRGKTESDVTEIMTTQDASYSVSEGGIYECRGKRGNPLYPTENSNQITINKILSSRAVVTRDPDWPEMYSGETITLRCEINDEGGPKWTYEWGTTGSDTFPPNREDSTVRVRVYSGGEFRCQGRSKTDHFSFTEWSAPITVTVSANKPQAKLKADSENIPEGGSVTLTCSVHPSHGWKYTFWYKQQDLSGSFKPVTGSGVTSAGQIQVSEEGFYQCVGERGNPNLYTESSGDIYIYKRNEKKAVITQHPDWTEFYRREKMTLKCEIQGVDYKEWDYEWETNSSNPEKPEKEKDFSITSAQTTHSGDYKCRGKRKSDGSSTAWSDSINLTVLNDKPEPVLNVSSSWLNPGDSVTLNCGVKNPSAGWRFNWFKTVPKLPGDSYNYDLLSGGSSGTEKNSFVVYVEKHTTGYVCRAGRGDPVVYSHYSDPKFVWSADPQSSASIRVVPNRTQHFSSDSVSLNCEGNASQWRVMRFLTDHTLRNCETSWPRTKSSCTIPSSRRSNGVIWCESESGEFSNAVNITKKSSFIILESPIYPVTEGSSVNLTCRLYSGDTISHVSFYHNNKLIQNDSRRERYIPAVSTSDEGFYKCQCSGEESAQSWMSVRAVSKLESSSGAVILIPVGVICGVILLVLLLLLYRHRKGKDQCCGRSIKSKNTDQNSAINHGDASIYESVKDQGEPVNGTDAGLSQDVTYSLIEIKNTGKKGKKPELSESAVYSDVKINTAVDTVTYAEVSCRNTGKDKKKKGNLKTAPTEDTVYSEVKPGKTSG